MTSEARRGGFEVGTIIESSADPGATADRVKVYGKDSSGVTQLFVQASDGTVNQLTPASAIITNFAPFYPRLPTYFPTNVVNGTKTLVNAHCYGAYYGKAGQPLTAVTVRWQVPATAGVGMTFAEVAIAKGTPQNGAAATLTVIGFANIATTITSTGTKSTAITLSTPAVATDDIWLLWAVSATTTAPVLLANNLGDPLLSGVYVDGGNVRPSTIVGTPTSFAVETSTTAPEVWGLLFNT